MKQIKVVVSPEGEITITPEGFKGEACKGVTANLERALGSKVNDTDTAELYEREEQRQDAKY